MITRDYIEIISSALTDKTGVKIKSGKGWHASIGDKSLTYDETEIHKLDFDTAKGLLIHELGHIKYTHEPKKTDMAKIAREAGHDTLNAFEDIRIEAELTRELGDFAEVPLTNLATTSINKNFEVLKNDYSTQTKLNQFCHLALMASETDRNRELENTIGYRASRIIEPSLYYPTPLKFSPEVVEAYKNNKAIIDSVINDAYRQTTTQELADNLDAKILPIVKKWLPEAEEEARKKLTRPSNGDGAGQVSTDRTKNAHANASGQNPTRGRGIKIKIDDLPELARTMCDYGSTARTLGQRIADILQERRATKYTGTHPSGHLLSKNIYKVLNGESRIFSHKLDNKPDDYRFYFCIDASGSMRNGHSAYYALQSGQILKLALEAFNLPIKFYEYDEEVRELKNLEEYRACGGGTYDRNALKMILDDAKKYPSTEQIIFMLTDGYTGMGDDRETIVKELERHGGHIYGVGVGNYGDAGLRLAYKNATFISNPARLSGEILRLMRETITR